jgi:hypothetical protein
MSTTSRERASRRNVLMGMAPPHPKQIEILNYLLAPDPSTVKLVDVVCGRGFGKTLLMVLIAVYCLSIDGNQQGLILEPDKPRMDNVFRAAWRKHVPQHLWKENKGERSITWFNGSVLYYGHRDIGGELEKRRDRNRGYNLNWVLSDEEAVKTDIEQYQNTLACIREKGPVRFYCTLTTPKIGAYKRLIETHGHKVFYGTSHDNIYLPDGFVEQLMANMSRDQIQREIYARFVALEGRIWKEIDLENKWPAGNVHYGLGKYDPKRPWWLFCDLGSATAAYTVVQSVPAVLYGERLFDGNVWVAVADLCPYHDGSAIRAFNILNENFGAPVAVTAGQDVNTRSRTDGKSIAYFANKVWPHAKILPTSESFMDRQIQFDRFSYLIRDGRGNRRFCVAKDFIELEPEGNRGVKQMLEEDVWPDDPSSSTEFLPKKADIKIQHIRDALLNGAVMVMAPPRWGHQQPGNRVG